MFWRLMEWGFLITAAIIGGRFIYVLWTGKPKYVAQKDLAEAQEQALVAEMEQEAENLKSRSQPKEPKYGHTPGNRKRSV